MSLPAGTRLGPYEIVAPLGAGGMGEVYRATDSTLKRQVAIKVLPPPLAADPDRLARFQREAEVLASLNHPHIAAVYGLEQASNMKALVMEIVEGPTLADRIARGAIPIDEALPIARQIAEALEAAHARGVIHRDLKPANIKVREDGTVKVLDFGLAKLTESASPGLHGDSDPSQSPTLTSPAAGTGLGIILGTAAYMSPEQARGRAVDKRTDIWAFGAVLYEMLTGARAFDGDDVTEMMAAVVKSTPNWAALPADVPPAARHAHSALSRERSKRADWRYRGRTLRAGGSRHAQRDPRRAGETDAAALAAGDAMGVGRGAAGRHCGWRVAGPIRSAAAGRRAARDAPADGRRAGGLSSADGLRAPQPHRTAGGLNGIWVLPAGGDRRPALFLESRFSLWHPAFSPDGRWIAYVSNESGGHEVYVQPYPGPGEKVRVSTAGGSEPIWTSNGPEILYRSGGPDEWRFLSAAVVSLSPFRTGTPRVLFKTKPGEYDATAPARAWDATADGQRFLLLRNQESTDKPVTTMHVVLHWTEELKRVAPAQ